MDFVGKHLLASFSGIVDLKFLNDANRIRDVLEAGIRKARATVLGWQVHPFHPQGCTILALLAESHVSVHTYPEHRALFFDAFTCGDLCEPSYIFHELRMAIGQCEYVYENFERSAYPSQRISRGTSRDNTTDRSSVLQWSSFSNQC